MPCHTAWHPSDNDVYRVKVTREEVPVMLNMLGRLCTLLQEQSKLFGYIERIKMLMARNPGLKMVEIVGFENRELAGQKHIIERNSRAGKSYGDLHSAVTAELCRLCRRAEQVPGDFFDLPTQWWWMDHKRSGGHCHEVYAR